MADYLLSFVKTGNPNGEGLPNWVAYTKENGAYQVIGARAYSDSPYPYNKQMDFAEQWVMDSERRGTIGFRNGSPTNPSSDGNRRRMSDTDLKKLEEYRLSR